MKKNLFQAVKTYINGVEVGETFTTKHLIGMVGDNEISTWWKQANQNPYYRTHTYKSYLKRTGFLSNPKRGVWKVEKSIPEFVTLGTIEFLLGYKKIYNGMTKAAIIEKINNTNTPQLQSNTFQVNDILEFDGGGRYAAERGATAICEGYSYSNDGDVFVKVRWNREGRDNGQEDGGYNEFQFNKIGELKDFYTKPGFVEKRSALQEEQEYREDIRILSEIKEDKIMKVEFDFNEGILRIKKYLENSIEQSEKNLFQDIKQCDDIDDLRRAISDFEFNERVIEQAIENLEQAGSILEVFKAVEDTVLGGDEERIISLLLNIEIEMI